MRDAENYLKAAILGQKWQRDCCKVSHGNKLYDTRYT